MVGCGLHTNQCPGLDLVEPRRGRLPSCVVDVWPAAAGRSEWGFWPRPLRPWRLMALGLGGCALTNGRWWSGLSAFGPLNRGRHFVIPASRAAATGLLTLCWAPGWNAKLCGLSLPCWRSCLRDPASPPRINPWWNPRWPRRRGFWRSSPHARFGHVRACGLHPA